MFKQKIAFLLLLLCASAHISAVENDSIIRQSIVLDEVIVTSSKETKSIKEMPASVSYIPLKEIQNRNITSIKDISSYVPNLFIPDYGSKLTSPVYIRGIGSKINAPSVGLYVDQIPFFEKTVFDFDFSEIDKIEVLRGPQGTLYGRNTMGGLINVYTKSPLNYEGTMFSFSEGNYNQLQASGSHYGKFNDNFGYAVSGNYKHSDGFFNNSFNNKKVDALNAGSGRIKLRWKKGTRLDANLLANYEYSDQGGYPYGIYDKTTGETADPNYNDYSFYRRGIFTSGLNINYSFDNFILKSVTGYQHFDDKQAVDQDFTTKDTYFATQTQRQDMLSQEFEIKSKGNKRYTWINGIFAFHQGAFNKVNLYYQKDAVIAMKLAGEKFTAKVYDTPTDGFALYHQSTYKDLLFKGLSATAGIRFDYEKSKLDYDFKETMLETTSQKDAFISDLNFSQFTPKFSLQYQFNPLKMVYASVTKGYKTGGFNTSFETNKDRSFDPEHSWNYEMGSKMSFFGNRINAEVALFYIDWKNQQITHTLTSGTGSMLKNAGKSESKGIELTLEGKVCKGLQLQVSYGYTEAKFKDYADSIKNTAGVYEPINYKGNYLPYIPRHTVAVGADYTMNLSSSILDQLVFSAQYTGTGKLYWNEKNLASQNYYGILNGKISVRKGGLMVDLWIKNATSQDYNAFYFESGKSFAQKGRPMTFGTTLSYTIK